MRIAYLSEEYPRPTEPVVEREVEANQTKNVEVRTFSLWRARAAEAAPEAEPTRTLSRSTPRALLSAHLMLYRSSPVCYLQALALAIRSAPSGGRALQLLHFALAGPLAHALREEQIDHLHAHYGGPSGSVAMLAGALADLPFSLALHGGDPLLDAQRSDLAEKLARAQFVACSSDFVRSQGMARSQPHDWGKLHVVHAGVAPERYDLRPHVDPGCSLLYMGNLSATKGLPLLLEAVDTLRHRFPELSLTLVGDGPERRPLEDRCRALGLQRLVKFAGSLSPAKAREELSRADVCVLPDFSAGIPTAAVEALAAGVPVVATLVGGLSELVTEESGFLVAPGDPDALAERVGQLLADPALRARLGAGGRARVEQAFDATQETAWLRRLFQASLLGGTRVLGVRPDPAEPAPAPASRRLLIISPCRNEAEFAHRTLDSIVGQSLTPALWVIVDDGSSDETPQILARYAAEHDWIRIVRREDRGKRAVGPGVIDAFYAGWDTIDPDDFDYVCKLDLDLDMPARYFETLIERMELNPRLGTCSGKAYFPGPTNHTKGWDGELISEACGDDTSVGATKLYRMECFLEIGGFVRQVMWDGIDCHRCRQRGWKACSWSDVPLRFIHLRPMGSSQKGIVTGRLRHGFGQWFMGTAPSYLLASALFRATRRPFLIGGGAILVGYLRAALQGNEQLDDPDLQARVRSYQRSVLLRGKRRATQLMDKAGLAVWRSGRRGAPAGRRVPIGSA